MYDVITIGSATRDVFLRSGGIETVRSRQFVTGRAECLPLGSKIAIDELVFAVGGSAANTAVTFARRGLDTAVVSKVGNDMHGEEIVRVLNEEGVDTHLIKQDLKRMSAYSVILLEQYGERSILAYRGAGETFTRRDVPLEKLKAKWFYVTHLKGKAAALFPAILRHAHKIGAKVAVNPGKTQLMMPSAKIRPLLNLIDVFIVNREEASYLTRLPFARERAIFEKLDDLVRGLVVMTEGPKGVVVSDGKTRWRAGVLKERRVVDRTGAGDAFGSGLVAALIERDSPSTRLRTSNIAYALRLASANATSVIEHIGTQKGILRKRDSLSRWGRLKLVKELV